MSSLIEGFARDFARTIVAIPGWVDNLETLCTNIHESLTALGDEYGSLATRTTAAERAVEILKDVASCEPEVFMERYFDLLPADLRHKMFNEAKSVLHESGVTFQEFKDETGETYLRVENTEALRELVADEVLERSVTLATLPIGELNRVH